MSEAEPDYFKVLGVSRGASQRDIDRARRAIVLENHPDRNPDDKEAEERTKEANEAHAELSDPTARKRHEDKLDRRSADLARAAKRKTEKEQKRKERAREQDAAEAFGGAAGQPPPPPHRPSGESPPQPPPPPPPRKPFRPPPEPPPLILKYPSPSKPPSAQEDVASVLENLVKFIGACLLLAIPYVLMNVLLPAIGVIDESGEDTPLEVLTLMVVGSACIVMVIGGVAYYRSGQEQEKRGVFPKVLWTTPDAERAAVIRACVARLPAPDRELFAVALFTDVLSAMTEAHTTVTQPGAGQAGVK